MYVVDTKYNYMPLYELLLIYKSIRCTPGDTRALFVVAQTTSCHGEPRDLIWRGAEAWAVRGGFRLVELRANT